MTNTEFWNSNDGELWRAYEEKYWEVSTVKQNENIERKLDCLNSEIIKHLPVEEFYNFLHDDYASWKFSYRKDFLSTTQRLLREKYLNNFDLLSKIQNELFSFDRTNICDGLKVVTQISGLGVAAGSGLLSLLFPKCFGTADQFIVAFLKNVDGISDEVSKINKPDNLTASEGVLLIKLMRDKAEMLNITNSTDYWTPRRIDKCLWTLR